MRLVHTHVWPLLRNLHAIAPLTAASRSASSKMISGAWPPSSMLTFLTVSAHCLSRILPTSVEPVNDSLRTTSLPVSSPPTVRASPVTTLNTPLGMPARSASSASASAEYGVKLAGFATTVQPAASAGAHFLVIMAFGKFQGVIAAHTPTGCLNTMIRRELAGAGIMSPYTRLASSAYHSTNAAP